MIFKILLIQKFYNLSDEKAEPGLNVNLLYMRFVGLSLDELAPDSTTIGRFRNLLINNNSTFAHKPQLFLCISTKYSNNL